MRSSGLTALGCLLFLIVAGLGLAILADHATPYQMHPELTYLSPDFSEWFGRDRFGRSQWDRAVTAAYWSYATFLKVTLVSLGLAMFMGCIAGIYRERWPDRLIGWLIGLLYTLPFYLLAIALAAVFGPGLNEIPYIIGAVVWAAPARLIRNEIVRLWSAPYTIALRAYGYSTGYIIVRRLLPHAAAAGIINLLLFAPEIITVDVALAFFGLGPQPPTPTLGRLVYTGLTEMRIAPWLLLGPSLALLCLCLLIHLTAAVWLQSRPVERL